MEPQPQSSAVAPSPSREDESVAARRAAMALLAEGTLAELADGLAAIGGFVDHAEIRPAETGLMMVRGRIGGDGAPFNVGEATVTRCAIRLASGDIGHAYVLGRDRDRARLAALLDALWQTATYRDAVERHALAPIRARREHERAVTAARTAATKVDFFTLVRGEA
jgi:alpha-D-ribose 1-methylphosphonate 5-triphosphate synthase subunit PhnG